MQQKVWIPLAIAVAFFVAACSGGTAPPPMSVAERNEVTDNFLATSPTVSGEIPAADSPTSP
ncbi:hypothetical protein [Amaricoccus macauensis]|uniref:hypothetical protein n=1 Tax=Amaricoccus macauensis TaxID=57001 RepID=UPI003C7CE668